MLVQAYLFFDGRCAEALAFYKDVLGAEEIEIMRFGQSPDAPPPGMVPEGWDDKVMHASFKLGDSLVMASDGGGCAGGTGKFEGFFLSLQVADTAEADRTFGALANGGEIRMPLGPTFFSARFGMVADRFGVPWMINVAA